MKRTYTSMEELPSAEEELKTNTEELSSTEELEQRHFQHVANAFLSYKKYSALQVDRKAKTLLNLPKHHQDMIPTQFGRVRKLHAAISANDEFLRKIVQCTDDMFVNSDVNEGADKDSSPVTAGDIDRVRTTLKQCVRDWSKEGADERQNTYQLILDELTELYPAKNRGEHQVLVPGAGLGRLMYDIAKLGFACQGNEFSLYMLFASNYILNMCVGASSESIHPWVHQSCNVLSNNDQIRTVLIPDISPQDLDSNCNFSMSAGDFLEVYTEPNSWDSVVMCFFLDTAHNVIEYIERAHHILKPGGYLINLGPLLYHFADIEKESSVELTYEEIRTILLDHYKFKLIKEKRKVKSSYIRNDLSMFTMVYDCVFLVLQKV